MAKATVYFVLRLACFVALIIGITDLVRSFTKFSLLNFTESSILIAVAIIGFVAVEAYCRSKFQVIIDFVRRIVYLICDPDLLIAIIKRRLSNAWLKLEDFVYRLIKSEGFELPSVGLKSTKEERDLYEKTYCTISKNAHFILIVNGIILTIYLAILKNASSNPADKIIVEIERNSNLIIKWIISQESVQSIEQIFIDTFEISLNLLFIAAVSISILYCLRCFNAGVFSRIEKEDVLKNELESREKTAIIYYLKAQLLFLNALVILICLFGSIYVKKSQLAAFTYWIFLFVIILSIILFIVVYGIGTSKLFLGRSNGWDPPP